MSTQHRNDRDPLNTLTVPKRANRARTRRREGGFVIPVLAVMALALIATLSILGIETARVKDAATIVRGNADRICKNVAQAAVTPFEAVDLFRREFDNLPKLGPYTTVTGARLVLPLPLSDPTNLDGVFYDFTARSADTCTGILRYPTSSTSPEISFSALAVGSGLACDNPTAAAPGVDCTLRYDICDRRSSEATPDLKYPRSMWSALYNAGNTVGCEITARVERVMPFSSDSDRTVSAKVAWWIPVRTTPPFLSDAPSPADFSGLSIGIATQLTTWAGTLPPSAGAGMSGPDDRFNFPFSLSAYNPKRDILSDNMLRTQRLNGPSGVSYGQAPHVYPSDLWTNAALPPWPQFYQGLNSPTRASEEFLTACVNPLVLVRNTIASTLVELAAAHGQLRNLTQIASINPRHKGSWATNPNRPVEIVPFGNDLTKDGYQHPFVTFFSDYNDDGDASEKLGGLPLQTHFVLPWVSRDLNNPNPNTNVISPFARGAKDVIRDTVLTQQLRYCLHLWDSDLIPRPQLPLHTSQNQAFLPTSFLYRRSLQDPTVPNPSDDQRYRHLDYGKPWPPTLNDVSVSRLLTAAEVVQSLGSSQLCPAPGYKYPLYQEAEIPQADECKQAGFNPDYDLEPDIVAYLQYQRRQLNPYPSPGLFRPVDADQQPAATTGEISPAAPMSIEGGVLNQPPPAKSVVVIITTKGLVGDPVEGDASSLVQEIQTEVQNLNSAGRPVLIVFIPATYQDSIRFGAYCAALRLGTDCMSPDTDAENNRLFLFSPYAVQYEDRYDGDGSEGDRFRLFWEDLLIDDDLPQDLYAPTAARVIFLEGIVGLAPKL